MLQTAPRRYPCTIGVGSCTKEEADLPIPELQLSEWHRWTKLGSPKKNFVDICGTLFFNPKQVDLIGKREKRALQNRSSPLSTSLSIKRSLLCLFKGRM